MSTCCFCARAHTHTHTHIYIYIYIYTSMCCFCARARTHTHTHTHIYIYMSMLCFCARARAHTHTHTHIYIYIHIYTHTHTLILKKQTGTGSAIPAERKGTEVPIIMKWMPKYKNQICKKNKRHTGINLYIYFISSEYKCNKKNHNREINLLAPEFYI